MAERPVVALLPADRRVRVGLVMPVVDRVVDVSVQPTSANTVLAERARGAQVPMTSVETAARRALALAAARANAWAPPGEIELIAAFGGVAFPLLAAAYDTGATTLFEVPRWAAPILAAATIRQAATVAFGASATRPVRRALVDAIRPLPSEEIDLTVLGLGLMGRDALEPDRLARVLGGDRVAQPVASLPDAATLRSGRSILDEWGPSRAERVLVEAAARSDGMALLIDTVRYARQLGDHGPPRPLPNRLDELHDVHRALMRSPPPTATERSTVVDPPPPTPARRARADPPHLALPPPAARRPVRADTPITPPRPVRALEGRCIDELAFVLPRTVGDLERWGRLLSNCIGDFGQAAVTGRSILVGVLRANRLVYVVELTPTGTIRQFCGRANRRPEDHDRRRVIDALLTAGAVDPSAPPNHGWLADVTVANRSARHLAR